MTDKPKRKRTPNRRRRLLWVLLPIVTLVLGLVALSPQIEAWLATDPFTPQCEVKNHKFVIHGSNIITDFENSEIISFDLSEYYQYHWWFDEQNYLIYKAFRGEMYPAYNSTYIMNTTTGEYEEISDSAFRYNVFRKSPHYLVQGSTFNNHVHVIDVPQQELVFYSEELPFDPYRGFAFSPDEKYLLIYGEKPEPSTLLDLETYELRPLTGLSVIGWFDEKHLLYQEENNAVFTHHVVTVENKKFEFESFDSDAKAEDISKRFYVKSEDGRWIGLLDNAGEYWLWDRDTASHYIVDLALSNPIVTARIHGKYLVVVFKGSEGIFYFYDLETGEEYPFKLHDVNNSQRLISPSGEFVVEWITRAPNDYYQVRSPIRHQLYTYDDLPQLTHDNWTTIDGHDHLLYSNPMTTDDMGDRLYYLINASSGERCKIGIWNSSEDFGRG